MSEQKFPPGWDAERTKRLIEQCDQLTEDEQADEDDAAAEEHDGQTVIAGERSPEGATGNSQG